MSFWDNDELNNLASYIVHSTFGYDVVPLPITICEEEIW